MGKKKGPTCDGGLLHLIIELLKLKEIVIQATSASKFPIPTAPPESYLSQLQHSQVLTISTTIPSSFLSSHFSHFLCGPYLVFFFNFCFNLFIISFLTLLHALMHESFDLKLTMKEEIGGFKKESQGETSFFPFANQIFTNQFG